MRHLVKWLLETLTRALEYQQVLDYEILTYRLGFQILLACNALWAMSSVVEIIASSEIHVVLLVALLFSTALVTVGVIITFPALWNFLFKFGFFWRKDIASVEEQMRYSSRLDHLVNPIEVDGHVLDCYNPEIDAYDINLHISREVMLEISYLADSYDMGVLEVIDQGLGLMKIQDECSKLNTEALMAMSEGQRFSDQKPED